MTAPWILLIGMAVVVCGVIVLRLHALLSLIAGALVVALLTPSQSVYLSAARASAVEVIARLPDGSVKLREGKTKLSDGGTLLAVPTSGGGAVRHVVVARAGGDWFARPRDGSPIAPTDLLLPEDKDADARALANQTVGERIAKGFGDTAAGVGIVIAMAAVIGQCLLESGAAERVIVSLTRALGPRRTALAFVFGGFLLTIPCFFETVFYLMIPLGKIMRARTGRDYTLYVMSIIAGGTMAHSLVPPTPGPLSAARELHVDLGLMMLGGAVVGLVAASAGYAYARWANRRWDIPLRESAGLAPAELEAAARRDAASLPPLIVSLVPILLPIALIGTAAVLEARKVPPSATANVFRTLGDKNVALMCAAACALLLVAIRGGTRAKVRESVQHALAGSAVMILIICAGGAFGQALRQTDVAASLRTIVPVGKLALLPLAFAMTTLIRTAQGSATVAMITVAGVMGPLAAAGGLGFHPLYVALAIGCGSKPIMWMNDAGFWVISRMSGMTEPETLKTATVLMAIMATVGLCVVVLGAWLLPLV